jgi:hypothetical protein
MRDAFLVVGLFCILTGLILRKREGEARGLGVAFAVVGAIIIATVLIGRNAHWW